MRLDKTEAGPYAWEVHCPCISTNYNLSQLASVARLDDVYLEKELCLIRTMVFDFTVKLLTTQLYARLSALAQALQLRLSLGMIQWAGRC